MKHKHHIVPKHMGGTNDPSNLVEVDVEQHAELHLSLYLEYGRYQDWVAYHMLSGQMGKEEIQIERSRIGGHVTCSKLTPEVRSAGAKKANSKEVRARKSTTMKRRWENPEERKRRLDSITSPEHKNKVRQNTIKAQSKMRTEGIVIGRKPKQVLFDGLLYHTIKEMSSALNLPLWRCYALIKQGKAEFK